MDAIIDKIGDEIRRFTETWKKLPNNGSSVMDELAILETEIKLKIRFDKLSELFINDFSDFRSVLREEKLLARTNYNIKGKRRWGLFHRHLHAVIYSPASKLLDHINLWLEKNDNPENIVRVPSLEPMYGPELASEKTIKIVRWSKLWLDELREVIKQEFKGSPHIHNYPESLGSANVKPTNETENVQLAPDSGTTTIDEPTNVFNRMPLNEVRSWFIQLAETNSKNGNPFLTAEQVGDFIDRAFCKGSFIEKLSINEKAGDKANIIGLFHLFYNYCITHQPGKGRLDPTATAEKYIRLLTDYFDNWTFEQVKNNFRNGGNWKRTLL